MEVRSQKIEDGSLKSEEVQDTRNEVRDEEKTELVEDTISSDNSQQITETLQPTSEVSEQKPQVPTDSQPKVSALSLSSIRAKKEMMEAQKGVVKEQVHFPTQAFTETEMLDFWFKYAQRLTDKGLMIMSSLLRISDPKLDGFKIIYELPNEGSKIDFEKEKGELLGYLRGHLHNHDITIEVIVNESVKSKVAFTAQDKFNRLKEINPNLEELRRMFDLDI
jgi:hypothetical protein